MRRELQHLYLVGIGGSGLSSLAAYLLERGDRVAGSEKKHGPLLELLRRHGATVHAVQDGANLPERLDALVHTAAVGREHPEVAAALERGIPVFKYAGFLGKELEGAGGIAVAGTHGKTSTTGLLAHILVVAGRDPSVVVGGFPRDWRLPGRCGTGPFVVEACEYDRSFLNLHPGAAIVTNVEADHLDYFGTEDRVVEAFQDFAMQVPAEGWLVVHESVAGRLDLARCPARVVAVGEGTAVTDRLAFPRSSRGRSATLHGPAPRPVVLAPQTPGRHNLGNAALAAALALRLGVAQEAVEEAVRSFSGLERRLELLGEREGRRWFSDYAHHPTEIRAVLDALRARWPRCRVVLVFQPHQVVRTRCFREEFAAVLARFDEVLLPGIFSVREAAEAREEECAALADAMRRRGKEPRVLSGLAEVEGAVERCSLRGDLIVLMGAGDIDDLAEPFRCRAREAAVV